MPSELRCTKHRVTTGMQKVLRGGQEGGGGGVKVKVENDDLKLFVDCR